jgi:cytochrome c oxidase subunit 3
MDFKIFDGNLKPKRTSRINLESTPVKLALWMFIVIIALIYVNLTIIYLSGKHYISDDQNELPLVFIKNSYILILTIFTAWWSYIAAKRNNLNELKAALIVTLGLGLYFIHQQKTGWLEIINKESLSHMDSTSAYFLIMTSLHVIQVVAGLIMLFVTLVKTFDYKVHSKNMLQIEISTSFWAFTIFVWIFFVMIYI